MTADRKEMKLQKYLGWTSDDTWTGNIEKLQHESKKLVE